MLNLVGHDRDLYFILRAMGSHVNHQKILSSLHKKYIQNLTTLLKHLHLHHGPGHYQLLPRVLQLPSTWPSYLPLLPSCSSPLGTPYTSTLLYFSAQQLDIFYIATRRAGINQFCSLPYYLLLEKCTAPSWCSIRFWSLRTSLCFLYSKSSSGLPFHDDEKSESLLWLPGPCRTWSSRLLPPLCFHLLPLSHLLPLLETHWSFHFLTIVSMHHPQDLCTSYSLLLHIAV